MSIDEASLLGDRYALEGVVGRGGMADVYRATDRLLGRQVAVKLLRDVSATDSDRARFVAEARTLARLNHVGLVTVLDAGTTSGQPYLVMELIDGPTLAERCNGGALDPTLVGTIAVQLADALAFAHAAGVVHRDVKPGNVMLGPGGRACLTDFGIARLIGDHARHTRTGSMIGSPAYLSPEQVRGTEVTPAADVYALGLVLLEALTGRRAYVGTPTEAALARLTTPPEIPAALPADWRRLLHAMTAAAPGDRPDAAEVAATLRRMTERSATARIGATPSSEAAETRVLPRPVPEIDPLAARTSAAHAVRRAAPLLVTTRLRWMVAALGLALLVVLIAVLVRPGPDSGGTDGVSGNVPPRLEEPLRNLHEAIHGSDR